VSAQQSEVLSAPIHQRRVIVSPVDLRFYLDPATGLPHIRGHDVTEDEVEHVLAKPGEDRVTATQKKASPMTQSKFLPGWDEARVRSLLAHYESQTDEEAVAEDEAAVEGGTDTVMTVPKPLVPAVRELIAKHQRGAGGSRQ